MARILIADKLHPNVAEAVTSLGCGVDEQPQLTADQLPHSIAGTDILVVRSTKVTEATLRAADQLALIVRAGAGVNTIDVSTASDKGIHVVNCPGVNAAAVAELTIGLLVAADRQIVNACTDLRSGAWKKKAYGASHGLKGRTLGVLGLGAIGQAVAKIALGMEMNVVAWSRSLDSDRAMQLGVERALTPLDVARQSDAVTVHAAFSKDTRHLVDEQFLSAMRDGSILVNTSRGELVDTAALKLAIEAKSLRVALDVYEDEPPSGEGLFDDTQFALAITGTPHIGASTAQTSEAIGDAVIDHVRSFVNEGRVTNSVNMGHRSPATHRLVIRHLNRVGVLASILHGLRSENINVEDMQNEIFDGARSAICTMHVDNGPSENLIATLKDDPSILQLSQFDL